MLHIELNQLEPHEEHIKTEFILYDKITKEHLKTITYQIADEDYFIYRYLLRYDTMKELDKAPSSIKTVVFLTYKPKDMYEVRKEVKVKRIHYV